MPLASFSAILRRSERGSALLMATIAAALLATAAGLLLMDTRSARAAAAEAYRLDAARFKAQALTSHAIVRADGDPDRSFRTLIDDVTGRVTLQDVSGLLDLNAAEPAGIASLLTALKVAPERAAELADLIADWRDADDLVRPGGGEREAYARAKVTGPGNRAFVAESELATVLAMTPALVACVSPYVTIYAGLAGIDRSAAPPPLGLPSGAALAGAGASSGLAAGRVVVVTAEAPLSPHAVLRRKTWVRFTGDAQRPYLIHRALEEMAPRAPDAPTGDCSEAVAASGGT
ncbi:MAG: proteinral secretion pathway protein K [Alphaproteobacteria bacterium]|nr:MAG: proteinral secretion pathway protein K [Caulobacteraceae bacterium]TPW07058.1 MAG: proteinral secretion pathway protein K [Alphaproteobacteria bacterium]